MSQPFMNWQTEPLPSVNSEATPSASSSPQPSSPTNCSRQEGQLFPAKLLAMINDDSLSISFKDGCIFVPDCSRLGAQAASWSAEYAAQHGRGSGSLASYRTLERAMNDYGIRLVRDKQWLEERGVKKGVGQMRIHPFLCEEAINLDLVTKSNKFYFAHSRDRYIDIARSVLQQALADHRCIAGRHTSASDWHSIASGRNASDDADSFPAPVPDAKQSPSFRQRCA
ncbi:hypothetical protein GQ42DRAFT_181551, partial [Ramicandelaber brevisporus]